MQDRPGKAPLLQNRVSRAGRPYPHPPCRLFVVVCGPGSARGSSTDQPVLVHAGEELAAACRVVSVIEVAALARDFAFLGG